MEIGSFVREHKNKWAELEKLLERFARKQKGISSEDIDQMVILYKKTSSHLAYLNTYYPQDETAAYLNDLVTRTHHILYKEEFQSTHQLAHFFKTYYISLLLKRRLFFGLACLLFFVGALSGFVSVQADPLNLYVILPPGIAENVNPDNLGQGSDNINSPVISARIMTNNIRVAIFAFVGGIACGIVTVYFLLYNGLIIGALAAFFWHSGKSYIFFAYILPHGVIELTAIFIAGGAGLYMGYRMLAPGRYSWKHQFLQSVRESAQLLLGTFPLFVIAGIIEGFITPSPLSIELKYGFASLTILLLLAYFLYGVVTSRHNTSLDLTSR